MTGPADDGAESLSRLIAGNDHLITQPGLVLALQQTNATPQQAQVVNQFVGSLSAEMKVRTATAAGSKIDLSPTEQQQLDAMGVDYGDVVNHVYDPLTALRKQLAAEGLQPKLAADQTSIITDPHGNPHTEPISAGSDYSKVIGSSASASVTGPSLIGAEAMTPGESARLKHSQMVAKQSTLAAEGGPHGGLLDSIVNEGVAGVGSAVHSVTRAAKDVSQGATKAWNLVDTATSQSREQATDMGGYARASGQNAEAMQRLGYDPNSVMSTLAFSAQGYASTDTSNAAEAWDKANPQGLYGMDGGQAVVEARAFLADPTHYEQSIIQDKTLKPEQVAERLKMVNSSNFQNLVRRVNADHASIGNDVARELGIDPVKHSTLHAITSTTADVAASFVLDPTAVALGAASGYQRASVAIKNFHDAEGITRILRAGEGGEYANHATLAQSRSQQYIRDLVKLGNRGREANTADDAAKMAQVQAQAGALPNGLGGLLSDFMGEDRFLRGKTAAEVQAEVDRGVKDVQPFITGKGDPIDTYDKAVEYLASKAAFFRLGGGKAPVEFSTMPGALSSYAFNRLKGKLAGWSASHDVKVTEKLASRLVGKAEADPGVASRLLSEGQLRRVLPAQDDAVDMLTSRVIAAKQDVQAGVVGADGELASASRALEARQAELEAEAPLAATDQGYGTLRGNRLRYGTAAAPTSALSKLKSIYTVGAARRARLIVARMTNQLPRDLSVDVTNPADAEAVRRVARTYLTGGDSNLFAARWTSGTAETRKAIVQALREQIYHAAGLTRSKAGREFLDEQAALTEHYAVNGQEVTDSFGRNAAQWPGQVQTEFRLPNFGKVHKLAAKVGLYEGTMGRFLNSNVMDRLNSIWRTGILGSPVTANRAVTEALLVAHVDPEMGLIKSLAAKSVLRDTGLLTVKGLHRSRVAESIANTIGFRDVGRLYRNLLQRSLSPAEVDALKSMPQDVAFERLMQQTRMHWAQEVDPSNTGDATEIAELGLKPTQVRYDTKQGFDAALRKRQGYEVTEEVDGNAGANAYAFTLGSRVNASPAVAKAVLDKIEGTGDWDGIKRALDNERLMNDTLYGKVFRDADGVQRKALTADEKALSKQQWAQQLVDDMTHLMVGRNGAYQHNLAGYIREHGHAPSADWLQDNVKGLDRPATMLRPQYAAVIPDLDKARNSSELFNMFAESVQAFNGKIYQWAVERLIQRNSTTPLYGLAYAKSKVSLQGLKEAYMEAGVAEPAAESIVARLADKQAWNRVAVMVDDPSLKLQMDVAARSFFAFSRATTLMIRRWGTAFWKNPAQARRLMLAYEGAEHSGLIYQDQNGQPMFLLPATGVAQEVLFHAISHIPGLEGVASYPVSDFQGRVASIIPGSNNPFQYQTTPFVSIGGRALAALFPNYREVFDSLDRKFNGDQAQGQGIVATLLPRLAKQFTDAEVNDSRDSVMNSAMVGALYNLYAAGKVPPEDASPAQLQQFFDRLQVGTQSTLAARFLLGTLSPATLSTPGDSTKPDFSYAARGLQSMKDEFTQLVNDTNGDWARALSIWTYLHPDDTVFTQSESQGLVKNTLLPSTQKAYDWMASHDGLIKKYGTLSAYFLPEQKPGDQFSMAAYRAQLEQGFRQRKTPQEFLDGVRVAGAGAVYYAAQDAKDSQLAAAQKSGDRTLEENIRKGWSIWSTQFKNQHPVFYQHLTEAASSSAPAMGEYRNLQQMVASGEVPGSAQQKRLVGSMVSTFDAYRAEMAKYPTNTRGDTAAKAAMTAAMQKFFDDAIKTDPGIQDLFNAVFRPLNERLAYSQPPDGS